MIHATQILRRNLGLIIHEHLEEFSPFPGVLIMAHGDDEVFIHRLRGKLFMYWEQGREESGHPGNLITDHNMLKI